MCGVVRARSASGDTPSAERLCTVVSRLCPARREIRPLTIGHPRLRLGQLWTESSYLGASAFADFARGVLRSSLVIHCQYSIFDPSDTTFAAFQHTERDREGVGIPRFVADEREGNGKDPNDSPTVLAQ